MSESLISRVGRIVTGSANQIVTSMEDAAPATVLAEAIREIDGAIDDVRAELGGVKAAKHNSSRRLTQESERHASLGERIRVAIAEGRDDLAEAAVATQLDVEDQLPVIEKRIADLAERETELSNYVRALQAKRRSMQAELAEIETSRAVGSGTEPSTSESHAGAVDRRVARATEAFDRVSGRASGAPAGAPDTDPAKLAELEELHRENRVAERLAQFKNEPGA